MKVGICAIMKDVYEPYLMEWLSHHRSIGVDWFFIYDNDSTIPMMSFDEDVIIHKISGKAMQMVAYDKCLSDMAYGFLPSCDRVAFIDEDEFIICENGDIKKTLELYTDFPALGITWRVFGSSGLKERTPEPQRSKFTQYTIGHPYEQHIKSIVDPSRTIGSSGNPHAFVYTRGNCVNVDKEPVEGPFTTPIYHTIWIDHYYTRSLQEWKDKVAEDRVDTGRPGREFKLFDEIDANCSGKKKKIHLIMPFSRRHLWDKLIKAYGEMNVILHPLTMPGEVNSMMACDSTEEWIQPFRSAHAYAFNQSKLLNEFIQNTPIIDDDYYVSMSDDDMYEQGVFDSIRNMDDLVVVISMKRGYRVPAGLPIEKRYPPTTLTAGPENMRIGCIGGEQMFIKGSILKNIRFDEEQTTVADGFVAETLKNFCTIRYEPDLFCLFNYYEPDRWKMMDGRIAFGCMVNDLMRVDMVLKRSHLDPSIPCHTILNPESATKGMNRLLDTIEGTGADIAILVHQDMHFRHGWTDQVKTQLEILPKNWVCAGVIGKDRNGLICGKFHDMRIPDHFDTSDIHKFPHPACCFDEAVIIINLKTGFRFDEALDSFDLYGTLVVLQAWEMGGTAWIIDAFCEHYCMRSFQWHPDQSFVRNYKWLFDRFNGIQMDSTALGLSPDAKERLEQIRAFMTSAGPECEELVA
jgi:hypothetical protein